MAYLPTLFTPSFPSAETLATPVCLSRMVPKGIGEDAQID